MTLFWLAMAGALFNPAVPRQHRRLRPSVTDSGLSRAGLRGGGLACTAALGSAAVALLLIGGTDGLLAGVLVAPIGFCATRALQRRQREDAIGPGELRSIALLLDLLAATLDVGAPPEQAIAIIAEAVSATALPIANLADADAAGGLGYAAPLSSLARAVIPLDRVGRLLLLGADPAEAWSELDDVPGYRQAAAAGRRCAASGSKLAISMKQAAAELRVSHEQAALARAERVGVWSLLPLGLCFLPAFVCIGIAPVVVGVAGQALRGAP